MTSWTTRPSRGTGRGTPRRPAGQEGAPRLPCPIPSPAAAPSPPVLGTRSATAADPHPSPPKGVLPGRAPGNAGAPVPSEPRAVLRGDVPKREGSEGWKEPRTGTRWGFPRGIFTRCPQWCEAALAYLALS